jgi:glycosyltransferase involved in cell wall biosynthesis
MSDPIVSLRQQDHAGASSSESAARVDERIRLMKFVTLFGFGGTERQFVNLGLALDAKRFALEYACMRRWGHFLEEVATHRVPLSEFPIRRLFGPAALHQQFRLARHLGRERIQIVHAYNFYSNVFAVPAAWLAGVPIIIASIRDRGVYLTAMQRHVQRFVCKLADCVLVNAESIKEWLVADGYDAGNIVVIRNGVDLPKFGGARHPEVRAELGIPEQAPVVAMMARFNPKKGIEDFIDAAAIVSWHRPDVRFLIVGEGHKAGRGGLTEDTVYRRSISERIRRLGLEGKVTLTGYRADVAALLSEINVSVLPSLSEGLSNVLLEAMAAGVPVVATRVGGTPEAVEHGETGLLEPPGDPQGLAEAVASLLANSELATRLGAAGRRAVRERFSMERMVHATEQLYLDLLVRKAEQPGWRGRIGLARPAFETGSRTGRIHM